MKKIRIIFAWLILIILLVAVVGASYVKFSEKKNNIKTELPPINNEENQKMNTALDEIVNNLNSATKTKELKEKENTTISALRKNNSIFISYAKEEGTITYEFNYDNSYLIITINKDSENLKKFQKVFELLNEANQKRLNNEVDLSEEMKQFFEEKKEYIGITTDSQEQIETYYIELNVKIEKVTENSNNNNTNE